MQAKADGSAFAEPSAYPCGTLLLSIQLVTAWLISCSLDVHYKEVLRSRSHEHRNSTRASPWRADGKLFPPAKSGEPGDSADDETPIGDHSIGFRHWFTGAYGQHPGGKGIRGVRSSDARKRN